MNVLVYDIIFPTVSMLEIFLQIGVPYILDPSSVRLDKYMEIVDHLAAKMIKTINCNHSPKLISFSCTEILEIQHYY
jgi:hypothetical protein